MEELFEFESLCIDKSVRQDVLEHLSLEMKIYIVLEGKVCPYLD